MRSFIQPIAITCITASTLFAVPATAQLDSNYYVPDIETTTSLTADRLRAVFSGKTHLGTYSFLRGDISTYAFTETTLANGDVQHIQKTYEKELVDMGQWEIEEDKICYEYDDPRLNQACFRIYVVGNCYYHYQVEVEGFQAFGFTARSIIKGERANCEPAIS